LVVVRVRDAVQPCVVKHIRTSAMAKLIMHVS
jgi:hypothetical protein